MHFYLPKSLGTALACLQYTVLTNVLLPFPSVLINTCDKGQRHPCDNKSLLSSEPQGIHLWVPFPGLLNEIKSGCFVSPVDEWEE